MKLKMSVASLIVLFTVTLTVYASALKIGFRFVDDYTYLYWAGNSTTAEYLVNALDPRLQDFNYRPLRRILLLGEYHLFQADATGYHLVQILIHCANALLVCLIVNMVCRNTLIGFVAGLLFGILPVISEAVLWISDETPLATFFALIAIGCWVIYVRRSEIQFYWFAMIGLTCALMTKESSVVVPVLFFLIEGIVQPNGRTWSGTVRRYGLMGILLAAYLIMEYTIQQRGVFTTIGGYTLGGHILTNYIAYLTMLVFPLATQDPSSGNVLLVGVGVLFIGFALWMRNTLLLTLVLMSILGLGFVVLASLGPGPRYLYLGIIPLTIMWALGIQLVLRARPNPWVRIPIALLLIGVVMSSGLQIADAAGTLGETARQMRVPYRDIMRQHPTFPNDTRLYLIEPPFHLSIRDIAGMFFLQYGNTVSVSGTFGDGSPYTGGRLRSEQAHLRDYSTAYIYAFDEDNRPIEIPVDKTMDTRSLPALPINFSAPIQLQGYELTSARVKPGQPLAIILYWRATGKVDKDYTVFVHVVNANGEIIAGDDSMPRSGKDKTSDWYDDRLTADGHVVMIPQDAPIGKDYHLEVGLYYLPTMERLPMTDAQGNALTDHIVIGPFEVVE